MENVAEEGMESITLLSLTITLCHLFSCHSNINTLKERNLVFFRSRVTRVMPPTITSIQRNAMWKIPLIKLVETYFKILDTKIDELIILCSVPKFLLVHFRSYRNDYK